MKAIGRQFNRAPTPTIVELDAKEKTPVRGYCRWVSAKARPPTCPVSFTLWKLGRMTKFDAAIQRPPFYALTQSKFVNPLFRRVTIVPVLCTPAVIHLGECPVTLELCPPVVLVTAARTALTHPTRSLLVITIPILLTPLPHPERLHPATRRPNIR